MTSPAKRQGQGQPWLCAVFLLGATIFGISVFFLGSGNQVG